MPKMTDQEFDDLFRQAANRISPEEHMPGDWDNMQHRLEVAERDARARNISLYSMVALLLLYSFLMPENLKFGRYSQASMVPAVEQHLSAASNEPVGTESSLKNRTATLHPAGVEHAAKAEDAGSAASGSAASGSSESGSPESKEDVLLSEDHPAEVVRSNKDAANGVRAEGLTQQGNRLLKAVNSSTATASTVQGNKEASGEKLSHSQGAAADNALLTERHDRKVAGVASAGVVSEGMKNDALGRKQPSMEGPLELEPLEIPSTDPLLAGTERSGNLQPVVLGGVADVAIPVRHPLFVKLAISPDFSSIDYGSAGKAGLNFGPMVEYGISPRFSISTGAIWSKKLYDQKNPEKSYGQGGYTVHADMLNGDCRILDIPLNVTYYVLPGRKTNLFVTVGSSSYIMLDEKYVYTVSRNNRNYEYVETYSNKNNEWFSMLNLSVGIQRQVARRWFVQGEPFLKAPMKGVGAGKVNLVSAGVFVSIKYWINP